MKKLWIPFHLTSVISMHSIQPAWKNSRSMTVRLEDSVPDAMPMKSQQAEFIHT